MFIKLTRQNGKYEYYNSDYIKSFHEFRDPHYTVLELTYGTELVVEPLEEIYEMLKGENK